ncbi:hypothetical protein PAPHI01_1384 [Pancytospora philotis]|nr:hypothetical protein PAPHI01_1384 [Pancytospora philotis]
MRTVIALRTSVIAASALRLGKDDSVRIESIVKEFKEKCWEQVTAKNAKQFESVCIIACGSIRNAISGWVNSLYFACKQDAHAKSFSRQAWTNNTTLVDNDCDGSWSFEFKEDTDDYLHSLYQNLEEFLESYELISKNGRKLSAADVSMVKARLQNWIAIHSRFTSFFHIAAMNMCTVEAQKAVIEEACVAMIKPGLWQHKDGELVNVDTRESLKDMVFGLFSRSSLDLTQKVNDTREYIKSHKDNEALPK